jgi:hypothetical protein
MTLDKSAKALQLLGFEKQPSPAEKYLGESIEPLEKILGSPVVKVTENKHKLLSFERTAEIENGLEIKYSKTILENRTPAEENYMAELQKAYTDGCCGKIHGGIFKCIGESIELKVSGKTALRVNLNKNSSSIDVEHGAYDAALFETYFKGYNGPFSLQHTDQIKEIKFDITPAQVVDEFITDIVPKYRK